MGMGYSYICKKCGHKYSVFPGVGMMYPHVYRQKLAEIAEGAYGTERKNLVEKTSYAAIDAEEIIYLQILQQVGDRNRHYALRP